MKKAREPFKSGWRESINPTLDYMLKMSGSQSVLSDGYQVHKGSVINSVRQALVALAEIGIFHRWRLVQCSDLLVETKEDWADPDLTVEDLLLEATRPS